MSDQEERIGHAAKQLQAAIHPLIHPQPFWDGTKTLLADPLYTRMRDAKTAATKTSGAPMQASKTPARMDVLAWFVSIDATVSEWPGPAGTTVSKLGHYHDRTWCPDELRFVKAVTRRCEHWCDTAKQLLGDNPPSVPLRRPCPLCGAMWHVVAGDRQWALKVTASLENWHAQCLDCKTVWASAPEQALFRRMLDTH